MATESGDLDRLAKLYTEGQITADEYDRMRLAVDKAGFADACDICANNLQIELDSDRRHHRQGTGHAFFNMGLGKAPGVPTVLPCETCNDGRPTGDFGDHATRTGHYPVNPGMEWSERALAAYRVQVRVTDEESRRKMREEDRATPLKEKIGGALALLLGALVLLAILWLIVNAAADITGALGL